MWTCTACRESVDDGFDVCWNCQALRPGAAPGAESPAAGAPLADPAAGPPAPGVADLAEGEEIPWAPEGERVGTPEPGRTDAFCRACGSRRMITDVRIIDRAEGNRARSLSVDSPGVGITDWLFSHDRHPLRADICGACGRVDLCVEDPEALYEEWTGSRPAPASPEPPPLPPAARREDRGEAAS